MGNEGRPIRHGEPLPAGEPDLAALIDPVALEERLKEARARRAAALAGRPALPPPRPAPLPPVEAVTLPPVAPVFDETAPPDATTVAAPVADGALARIVRVPVWAIFVTGIALGAAVVALVARPSAPLRPAPAATVAAAPEVEAPAPAAAERVAALVPDAASATPTEPPAPPPPAVAGVPTPALAELEAPAGEPAVVPAPALETARLAAPEAESPAPPPVPLEPARAVATADAAPLPARVIIHYPPSASDEAQRASAALSAAGIGAVNVVPVRLDISRSNVRYYHDADGAPATTVADLLGTLGDEAPLARDFTDYRTPAAAGTLEVWLAGETAGSSTPPVRPRRDAAAKAATRPVASTFDYVRATPGDPAPAGDAPDPAPVETAAADPDDGAGLPPEQQAQAVARIIVERAYQRLMNALPAN